MSGEKNLQLLLRKMKPVLQEGSYVFVSVSSLNGIKLEDIAMIFRESEGFTLILEEQMAQQMGFADGLTMGWITLTVHSSLEAVGLTAAFSQALAQHGISCNVVAGFHHDHIFVPLNQAGDAIEILSRLSAKHSDQI